MAAGPPLVRLLEITPEALDAARVLAAVADADAGGTALFVGAVRNRDGGKEVTGLSYTAHPTALAALRDVAERVADQHGAVALAAVHRVGDLAIGDLAVVVAVACAHRAEAFAACRQLIDELKATVPIWKHQLFADGSQEWVGTP